MKIRLNAQNQLVGYFEVPPFRKPPDTVVWGTRVFNLRVTTTKALNGIALVPVEPPPQDDCAFIYDEGFAYAITGHPINSGHEG